MNIARINRFYIVVIWFLIMVLLGSVLYIGYSRNVRNLQQLMVNEAERLVQVVTVATAVGIDALEDIEYLTAFRLLDNARLIDHLSDTVPPVELLSHIVREHDLHAIEFLDGNGDTVVRIGASRGEQGDLLETYSSEIESVLSGAAPVAFIGFNEDRHLSEKLKGVMLRRSEGGAIVIETNMDTMLEYRKSFGIGTLGTLFKDISTDEGVSYIVLQDTLGIVAASPNISEITRIQRDPFLVEAYVSGWGHRTLDVDGEAILEVVSSLEMNGRDYGLLRIGLTTRTIEDITQGTVRHFAILFVVALISGAIVFLLVMQRQNYMILNQEHDRILREVKIMEEDTRRSERLASMGNLAAGVAHEIRNPLNSISLIVQQLKDELQPDEAGEEHRGMLSTVGNEITRISAIIEHFLKYAKPPELSISAVPLEQLVSEVSRIVQVEARMSNITLKTVIDQDVICYCDVDQMKQALVNIMLNAVEELHRNGVITIRAGKRNGSIFFRIEDSGEGIREDIIPRIFDPYFTTKERGTGLGLSEVHRIVTAHGGRVFAENKVNNGAVFGIDIPVKGT